MTLTLWIGVDVLEFTVCKASGLPQNDPFNVVGQSYSFLRLFFLQEFLAGAVYGLLCSMEWLEWHDLL